MSSISKFISKFQHGARANLFKVEVSFLGEDMQFFCKSAQFPGHSIDKIPMYYQNNKMYIAGDFEFTDWTLTIINDKSFAIRDNLEMWSSIIKAKNGTSGATDIKEYLKDCYVYQLDENGDEIRGYKLSHAFPTEISPIDVSFDSQDTIQEYTVTFTYGYYEQEQGLISAFKGSISSIKNSLTSLF